MHHANVIKIYAGVSFIVRFVMAALCNRAGHYIFALWFLVVALCNRADHNIFMLFLSSFFPRLISAVRDWIFTIVWHMVWP